VTPETAPANSILPDSTPQSPDTNLAARVTQPADTNLVSRVAPRATVPTTSATPTVETPQASSDLVVHAREITPLATAPAAASRPNSFSVIVKRSLVAATVLAALSLVIVFRRPRQNHVSLITHSINRDRR
jgi:hypothetical protein